MPLFKLGYMWVNSDLVASLKTDENGGCILSLAGGTSVKTKSSVEDVLGLIEQAISEHAPSEPPPVISAQPGFYGLCIHGDGPETASLTKEPIIAWILAKDALPLPVGTTGPITDWYGVECPDGLIRDIWGNEWDDIENFVASKF